MDRDIVNTIQPPMNKIREKLPEFVPYEQWPCEQPNRKQVSRLLGLGDKGSLREIQARLNISRVLDDREQNRGGYAGENIYLIDIFTKRDLYWFESISRCLQRLMVGRKKNRLFTLENIINNNYVFHVNGNLVVVSRTRRRDFQFADLTFFHKHNMSTFRLFLSDLGYKVSVDTGLRDLRKMLEFDPHASLKTMMESFGLQYCKKTGDYSRNEPVFVKIVSADRNRIPKTGQICMRRAAKLINVYRIYIRDYINRSTVFKYQDEDCVLVFA